MRRCLLNHIAVGVLFPIEDDVGTEPTDAKSLFSDPFLFKRCMTALSEYKRAIPVQQTKRVQAVLSSRNNDKVPDLFSHGDTQSFCSKGVAVVQCSQHFAYNAEGDSHVERAGP